MREDRDVAMVKIRMVAPNDVFFGAVVDLRHAIAWRTGNLDDESR